MRVFARRASNKDPEDSFTYNTSSFKNCKFVHGTTYLVTINTAGNLPHQTFEMTCKWRGKTLYKGANQPVNDNVPIPKMGVATAHYVSSIYEKETKNLVYLNLAPLKPLTKKPGNQYPNSFCLNPSELLSLEFGANDGVRLYAGDANETYRGYLTKKQIFKDCVLEPHYTMFNNLKYVVVKFDHLEME